VLPERAGCTEVGRWPQIAARVLGEATS
jgi:hypothetical protein